MDKAGIKQNNFKSSLFDLNIGVRQGCIMSPILFNIFLCDLAKSLHEMGGGLSLDKDPINSIFWADDLVMFANSEKKLQEMLNLLEAYCKENELLINTKKTKCMIFNKSGRILSRDFFLNNTKLEIVRSYKYLGFILCLKSNKILSTNCHDFLPLKSKVMSKPMSSSPGSSPEI